MEAARNLSPAEAEVFWTSGCDARRAAAGLTPETIENSSAPDEHLRPAIENPRTLSPEDAASGVRSSSGSAAGRQDLPPGVPADADKATDTESWLSGDPGRESHNGSSTAMEAMPSGRGVCRYCGCTWDRACLVMGQQGNVPCHWIDAAQEVCSAPACVSKWRQEIAAISREVCERPLGVDVPGVGCVGSFEISPLEVIALRDGMPEEPATLPGEPYRPGEIPPSLRRYLDDDTSELLGVSRGESEVAAKEVADALDRRQELLGALIGASWALMEDSVPERIEMTVSLRPMCLLCRRSADTREWINHREDCKTERVRKILLELGGIVVPTGSHEGEPEARTIGGEPVRMPANAVIGAELLDPYVNGAEPLAEPPAKGAPDGAAVAIGEADIEALNRYAALEADRNKLVTRLLFTARSKVQRDLSGAYCGECGVYLGVGPHAASCLSGEILTILAQLCSLAGDPMPSAARKEAAAEGAAL